MLLGWGRFVITLMGLRGREAVGLLVNRFSHGVDALAESAGLPIRFAGSGWLGVWPDSCFLRGSSCGIDLLNTIEKSCNECSCKYSDDQEPCESDGKRN